MNTKKHWIGCCCALLSSWLVSVQLHAAENADPASVVQTGFDGLKRGSFGDSGANTYLSAKGKIQTIHRWDLNRDGEIDLLFTQDHNTDYAPDSMIYWGGSDGPMSLLPELPQHRSPYTLARHWEHARKSVSWIPSLGGGRCVIADLNTDGYPDILFGNMMHNFRQDMPAYIYWGSAQGYREVDRTILPGFTVIGVAVGDFNGDGLPDVVLANQGFERPFEARFGPMINNRESYVYWGDPNGFDASRRLSLPTISAADVAVGDLNGDGYADIAFANSDGEVQTVYVYWGDGKKGLGESARQVLTVSGPGAPGNPKDIEMLSLLSKDLTGDGISDLVVGTNRNVLIYPGSKSGVAARPSNELPAQECHALEAGDLNGDGHADLVVANSGKGATSTIHWGGAQGLGARQTALPTRSARTVKAGDLNGDGRPDLLFGNFNSGDLAQIFWGGPDGFIGHRVRDLQGFGVVGIGLADLNGDGHLDTLLSNHQSGSARLPTAIYWGNKEHHYSSAAATFLEPGGAMMQKVADFDDDGHPDIVLVHGGVPFVWWGGAAGYDAKNRTELPVKSMEGGRGVSALGTADMNRDGHLDLLYVGRGANNPEGTTRPKLQITYGNGRRFGGELRTEQFQLSGHAGSGGAISLSIADLNRDGHLDVIVPLLDIGIGDIWWGGAAGFDGKKVTKFETNGASQATVADLDGDRWLEVIFTSGLMGRKKSNQVVIGGTGVKGTTRNSETLILWGGPDGFKTRNEIESFNALDATVADLNRDGHLDLALTNYLSDTTRELPAIIYWGDGARGYSNRNRTFIDAASSAALDAHDLNRDGWPELIVSNHQKNFSHLSGTNIYWGGEKGYSMARRTNLPTIGVHMDTMVDAGNIYDRKFAWDYVSAPIQAPAERAFARVQWKAETELGTGVKFQVRSAGSEQDLNKAAWTGPEGATSYYTVSGATLAGVDAKHRWLQYRAILTAPDGGNSAVLSEVEIVTSRR